MREDELEGGTGYIPRSIPTLDPTPVPTPEPTPGGESTDQAQTWTQDPYTRTTTGGFEKGLAGDSQARLEEYNKWQAGEETEVPEFAFTIHAATRGMNNEDRGSYLQSFRDKMTERVQRYEWRKAKGVALTKEQETVYDELLTKLQTLNQMIETPDVYTQYMEGAGALIGQKLGIDYGTPVMGTYTPIQQQKSLLPEPESGGTYR